MSAVHGKGTVIKVGATDISRYTTTSKLSRGSDSHDITGYGKDDYVYAPTALRKGTFTCEGWFDNTASTGPGDVLAGNEGTILAITRQPEGAGSGKPQQLFDGLLTQYDETNPVNDVVRWSASFTVSDAIDDTPQT